MAKYGVKVSQQGVPVDRAADYQMVLDSNWKFLNIYDEVDIDVQVSVSGSSRHVSISVFEHGLGYVAAFEFFPSKLSNGQVLYNGPDEALKFLRGDKTSIFISLYHNSASPQLSTFRIVGKLRVFALNILEEYTAPTVARMSTTSPAPSKYGAKFIDRHKGLTRITDESLSAFSMNTQGKQLSIHKHGQAQANQSLTIEHNVGYPPSYMLCKVDTREGWTNPQYAYPHKSEAVVGGLVSAYYLARPNPKTIEFRGAQASLSTNRYAYIIFKDPMEIAG